MTKLRRGAVPKGWTIKNIGNLRGKYAVVTGSTSGIGYASALELIRNGAIVIVACHDEKETREAVTAIHKTLGILSVPFTVPKDIEMTEAGRQGYAIGLTVDLGSQASVESFAVAVSQTFPHLDILINNAGIMAPPFRLTMDGFESQLAINYLGHFALTARLFPLLRKSQSARIVNVSSSAHRLVGRIDMNTFRISTPEKYKPMQEYAKSKLYCLIFAIELNRQLRAKNYKNIIAVACHPGYAATGILTNAATQRGCMGTFFWGPASCLANNGVTLGQSPLNGARPTLFASTGNGVENGDFYGPCGILTFWGNPTLEKPAKNATNEDDGRALWKESEKLTGITFQL